MKRSLIIVLALLMGLAALAGAEGIDFTEVTGAPDRIDEASVRQKGTMSMPRLRNVRIFLTVLADRGFPSLWGLLRPL